MIKAAKIGGAIVVLLIVIAAAFFAFSPTLRSDPNVGLSPNTHQFGELDVRDYTDAPLGAEVKVYLPISAEEGIEIVSDFDRYGEWVSPPPENVSVDNSANSGGAFGAGSKVSYSENETDAIEFFEPGLALLARPEWGLDDFEGHRGVVIVTPEGDGIIMHMRRYFDTKSMKGAIMSKMMPIFMEQSAQNLADQYGGEVL